MPGEAWFLLVKNKANVDQAAGTIRSRLTWRTHDYAPVRSLSIQNRSKIRARDLQKVRGTYAVRVSRKAASTRSAISVGPRS